MFFLSYKHTADGLFDGYSEDFRPLSEDFRRFSKIALKARRIFPFIFRKISENFRRSPKIAEDCQRLLRKTRTYFDDTTTNVITILETNLISEKSSISSHARISYLHMWGYHIFTCEDIVSFISISYHSVYHWLLCSRKRLNSPKICREMNFG